MECYDGSDAPMAPELPQPPAERLVGPGASFHAPKFWKGFMPLLALFVISVLLFGCTSTKPTLDGSAIRSAWCSTNEPQRYTPEQRAVLTPEQKDAALKHNRRGADWCGWKA